MLRTVQYYSRIIINHIKGLRVSLFGGYERISLPSPDMSFLERLWSENSPISLLISQNDSALSDAEEIAKNRFRVFSRTVEFPGDRIEWHRDAFSGHTYASRPSVAIRIRKNEGHDIVVPWELSRLQWIPTIIEAHRRTNDPRFAAVFTRIVDDWIRENPFEIGINWMNTMDASIRALNLMLGISYFRKDIPHIDAYLKVLWAHALFIHKKDFKTVKKHRNNHFLVSAVGLSAISLCFAGETARSFFRVARTHLEEEILRQFRIDGGNFESSTDYHQFALEAALTALCMMEAPGAPGIESARDVREGRPETNERLMHALRLTSDYMDTFGRSPMFGDGSGGRVLVYRDYFGWQPQDHSFLEEIANRIWPRDVDFHSHESATTYPVSGYAFYRSESYGICLNAAAVEEDSHGGHSHCDKTSFVLRVAGHPVFIDSGTYCYTPDIDARFAFRRTRAHNLVVIDREEQAEITPEGVFLPPLAIAPRLEFCPGEHPAWKMEHRGYARIEKLGVVSRSITCMPREISITERIDGEGEHTIEIVYHLHPDIIHAGSQGRIDLALGDSALCSLLPPEGYTLQVEKGSYSRTYGESIPSKALVLAKHVSLPATIEYSIIIGG